VMCVLEVCQNTGVCRINNTLLAERENYGGGGAKGGGTRRRREGGGEVPAVWQLVEAPTKQ